MTSSKTYACLTDLNALEQSGKMILWSIFWCRNFARKPTYSTPPKTSAMYLPSATFISTRQGHHSRAHREANTNRPTLLPQDSQIWLKDKGLEFWRGSTGFSNNTYPERPKLDLPLAVASNGADTRKPPMPSGPGLDVTALDMITAMRSYTSNIESGRHGPSPSAVRCALPASIAPWAAPPIEAPSSVPNLPRTRTKTASVAGEKSSDKSVRAIVVIPPLKWQSSPAR